MTKDAHSLAVFVLAGGGGTRLWPWSVVEKPKPFLALQSNTSFIDQTLGRAKLLSPDHTFIVGSAQHQAPIIQALARSGIDPANAIFEPVGRNTAASVAIAIQQSISLDPNMRILILPSDHSISGREQFRNSIDNALADKRDDVVLFGVKPKSPDTGFGYIEVKDNNQEGGKQEIAFVEKPCLSMAQKLFEKSNVFWNCGMFLFSASTGKRLFETHAPEIWQSVDQAWRNRAITPDGSILDNVGFENISSLPFDKAIVEKTTNLKLIPAEFDWADMGTWQSIHSYYPKDKDGNVVLGDGEIMNSKNSLVLSDDQNLTVHGLDGQAVIAANGHVYFTALNDTNDIKDPISHLKSWLLNIALPFWDKHGVDHLNGGFHEVVDCQGNVKSSQKRLRTMARQTISFSIAARNNWHEKAASHGRHGLHYLESYWEGISDSNGKKQLGKTITLYDLALVLHACAELVCLIGDDATKLGRAVLSHICTEYLHIEKGSSTLADQTVQPPDGSSSYMHLLDALQAWQNHERDEQSTQAIETIINFFNRSLFDDLTWTVRETVRQQGNAQANNEWSPGHQYEWITLLQNCDGVTSTPVNKLLATNQSWGRHPTLGFCHLEMGPCHIKRKAGTRIWAQTEMMRYFASTGAKKETQEIAKIINTLHIAPAPSGIWIDQLDGNGLPCSTDIAASVFYHIVRAIDAASQMMADTP